MQTDQTSQINHLCHTCGRSFQESEPVRRCVHCGSSNCNPSHQAMRRQAARLASYHDWAKNGTRCYISDEYRDKFRASLAEWIRTGNQPAKEAGNRCIECGAAVEEEGNDFCFDCYCHHQG